MSDWKQLPRPATPGPWKGYGHLGVEQDRSGLRMVVASVHERSDRDAIAALPDYVAEVDRLRAWVEWLEGQLEELRWLSPRGADAIRAGEWPEGSER